MAEIPGDLGGGGVASMCEISNADMTGILGNFMSRIEELERTVSQLLSANVSANQLSDISQQVGWVYDVTYMGIPGWIQTAAGTLIPPAGFSLSTSPGFVMSDGNTYPAVSVDSDGVIQFGFTATGEVAGTLPTQWGANSIGGYIRLLKNSHSWVSGDAVLDWDSIQNSLGSDFTWDGAEKLTINSSGFYLVTTNLTGNMTAGTTVLRGLYVRVYNSSDIVIETNGSEFPLTTIGTADHMFSVTFCKQFAAGDYMKTNIGLGTGATFSANQTILKISS